MDKKAVGKGGKRPMPYGKRPMGGGAAGAFLKGLSGR